MKTFMICGGVGLSAFLVMGYFFGMIVPPPSPFDAPEIGQTDGYTAKPKPVEPKFPEDLVPAAQANPVPTASEYKPGNESYRIVVLRPDGMVHDWQDQIPRDWKAESVQETSLVVVVGVQRKSVVSVHTYANNAPPVTRYRHDLEISVVEAKTGKILANRVFINNPRPLSQVERWETTSIGRVVTHRQVFAWVSKHATRGFPELTDNRPIISEID